MIKVYRNIDANCIFMENTNGAQFSNSLQAIATDDNKVTVIDLAKSRELISNEDHTEFVDENEGSYGASLSEVVDALNTEFTASGTSNNSVPVITSNTTINAVSGDVINYILTADHGVGFEWENLPSGLTTVVGNVRHLIGVLTTGVYSITMRAINYNGMDTQTLTINVSEPAFANTKSTQFENNDYLSANSSLLTSTLGRTANGSGTADAWTIALWFKAGTSSNTSQTILTFGGSDRYNEGHIKLQFNGNNSTGNKLQFTYGSSYNNVQLETPTGSVPKGTWKHIVITYNGGTTGAQLSELSDYYSRFSIFIDGAPVSVTTSHSNFGYTGSVLGEVCTVGRYYNGQHLRNACKVDELAMWDTNQSSNVGLIYNSGVPHDLLLIPSNPPKHWWRCGDGDTFPTLTDSGTNANCNLTMQSMTSASIVNDAP